MTDVVIKWVSKVMGYETDRNKNPDWGVEKLVAELRQLRLLSLESRHRQDFPPKLPSRKILSTILDNLGAVMFPNRLGLPDLTDEGIDYFVGHTLDSLLKELNKQIRLELQFVAEQQQARRYSLKTQILFCIILKNQTVF